MADKQDEVEFLTAQLSRFLTARGNIGNILSSIHFLDADFKNEISMTDDERRELYDLAQEQCKFLMELIDDTRQKTQNYYDRADDKD